MNPTRLEKRRDFQIENRFAHWKLQGHNAMSSISSVRDVYVGFHWFRSTWDFELKIQQTFILM